MISLPLLPTPAQLCYSLLGHTKKLFHLAVDSLLSPSTVTYFLTQSQSSSSHSVSSSRHGHYFTRLSPFTLTWSLLRLSSLVLSCLTQLFSSVPPNAVIWLQLFRYGGCSSSSHHESHRRSSLVAASPVFCTQWLLFLCVFFLSLHWWRKVLFPLWRYPGGAAGKFDASERKWLVGILQAPGNGKGTVEAKWEKQIGTACLWRQTQWAEQLHPDIKQSWTRRVEVCVGV